MFRKLITTLLLATFIPGLRAQDIPEDSLQRLRMEEDFVTASVCIADPTDWHDDMLGVLGHAFIRLQCPTFDMDYCYSYEGQSANEDFLGLVRGSLKMGLFAAPTQEYIEPYRRWKRTVREYTLALPPEADLRLWEVMDRHLADGVELPLDLTEHGCTQTIVQFITEALDSTEIVYGKWPEEFKLSRSEIADKALEDLPWLRLMIKTLGMYGSFDKDCSYEEKIVIPYQLAEVWQHAKVNGKPLISYKGDLTKGESPVVERTWFTPRKALCLLIVLVVIIVALVVRRRKSKVARKTEGVTKNAETDKHTQVKSGKNAKR